MMNKDIDIGHCLLILACIVYFFIAIYKLIKGIDVSFVEFGTGFSLLFGGGAAGIAIKQRIDN